MSKYLYWTGRFEIPTPEPEPDVIKWNPLCGSDSYNSMHITEWLKQFCRFCAELFSLKGAYRVSPPIWSQASDYEANMFPEKNGPGAFSRKPHRDGGLSMMQFPHIGANTRGRSRAADAEREWQSRIWYIPPTPLSLVVCAPPWWLLAIKQLHRD